MTSQALPDGGSSLRPGQADAVAAIAEKLREEGNGPVAAPDDLSARGPTPGCPVCGCQPPRTHQVPAAGPMIRLVAWLAENYHRPDVRVDQLAAAAGISVRRLQVLCKRDYDRTPMQLLTAIRLHLAYLALTSAQGAPPPGEVARAVGFTRVSRFSSAYRSQFGTAPAATARITPAHSPGTQAIIAEDAWWPTGQHPG
jgi:AraC-like DNA-binding protein